MATIKDDSFLLVNQDGTNYKIKKSELQSLFTEDAFSRIVALENKLRPL